VGAEGDGLSGNVPQAKTNKKPAIGGLNLREQPREGRDSIPGETIPLRSRPSAVQSFASPMMKSVFAESENFTQQ
jgi:hypothetical protein